MPFPNRGSSAPVVITGGRGVGSVATAVVAQGWNITGGQWYNDGVAISGATGLTYTRLVGDIGKVLTFVPTGLPFTANGGATSANVPGAPTIGTAVAGNGQAGVLFTAPVNNGGSAITLYTVYALDAGGNVVGTQTATQSPVPFVGLTNGVAYAFRVAATNSVGMGPLSALSNYVTPVAAPANLLADGYVGPGTSTANGFMTQATTKDTNRLQTIIRNQTPFMLVTAEQTSDNLTVNQPPVNTYVDLPPNSQNRIEGNAAKMWVGVKAITPSSVTSSGTLCTIVFAQPHAMSTGGILTLIDFVPTGYNAQLYSVTVIDANTLTVTLAASAGAVTTMGKAFPRPITGVTVQTTTTP